MSDVQSDLQPAVSGVKPDLQQKGGFTLIELIVVIGIIAATAGVLGLALRGDNPSVALQSAQGTVASVLAAARSEAALNNTSAAFVVFADTSDTDRYLHALAVAELQSGTWVRTGDYVFLPQGVYVVPPTSLSPLPSAVLAPVTVDGKAHFGIAYSALGAPDYTVIAGAGANHQIVLASARRNADASLTFDNAANIRGVVLSDYGAVTFVNDSSGF